MPMRRTRKLKIIQIIALPWQANGEMTSSLVGLGEDGIVYRFLISESAWRPYPMEVIPE